MERKKPEEIRPIQWLPRIVVQKTLSIVAMLNPLQ